MRAYHKAIYIERETVMESEGEIERDKMRDRGKELQSERVPAASLVFSYAGNNAR